MTVTTYLLGLVLVALATVPLAFGSVSLRRALLPVWSGPPAWVLDALACTSVFVLSAELVGIIGFFSALSVGVVCALIGAVAWFASKRVVLDPDAASTRPAVAPSVLGPVTRWFSVGVVALASASWLARTGRAVRFGMGSVDSVWYHMPAAARFVQEGRITEQHAFDTGTTTVFYPQNSGLIHAFGLSAFDSDVLSPMLNLGWFALALLAAWCIGRSRGLAPLTMAGVAVLLSTPVFVGTQPGTSYNDTLGLALTLGAVGLLYATPTGRRVPPLPVLAVMAAALGVAVGTKWTSVMGAGALVLGILVLAPARTRLRVALISAAAALATGVYWYIKNAIDVGNPVPPVGLKLGPFTISKVHQTLPTDRISSFLFDGTAWREDFLPGFDRAFAFIWPVLLLAVAAGLVLALVKPGDARDRVLGVVGVAVIVGYIVTPQALTLFGRPSLFWANLRYPAIGLAAALVLLPLTAPRRVTALVAVVYGVLLVGLQANETLWPWRLDDVPFAPRIERYAVLLGILGGLAVLAAGIVISDRRFATLARNRGLAGVATVCLLLAGFTVARLHDDNWYSPRAVFDVEEVNRGAYRWAQGVEGARIAVIGDTFQYPLYGADQSNFVQYLAIRHETGAPVPIKNCPTWRRVLNRGDYDYVVVSPSRLTSLNTTVPEEAAWTRAGGDSRPVLRDGATTVFRITGPLDPGECPSRSR